MDTQEVLTRSVEKLVRLVQSLEARIVQLETNQASTNKLVEAVRSDVSVAMFNSDADNQLHSFLTAASQQDATEARLTQADITNGINRYKNQKRIRTPDRSTGI